MFLHHATRGFNVVINPRLTCVFTVNNDTYSNVMLSVFLHDLMHVVLVTSTIFKAGIFFFILIFVF